MKKTIICLSLLAVLVLPFGLKSAQAQVANAEVQNQIVLLQRQILSLLTQLLTLLSQRQEPVEEKREVVEAPKEVTVVAPEGQVSVDVVLMLKCVPADDCKVFASNSGAYTITRRMDNPYGLLHAEAQLIVNNGVQPDKPYEIVLETNSDFGFSSGPRPGSSSVSTTAKSNKAAAQISDPRKGTFTITARVPELGISRSVSVTIQ